MIASNILAEAAFSEGKDVSAFPYFGVERRGAPVTAYTKIDTREIRVKSGIYEPDYVIVMDQSLVKAVDVVAGLKDGGKVLVNTTRKADDLDIEGADDFHQAGDIRLHLGQDEGIGRGVGQQAALFGDQGREQPPDVVGIGKSQWDELGDEFVPDG